MHSVRATSGNVHDVTEGNGRVNLPLLDVPLSRFVMRPSIAVPRASVLQIAWR